MTNYSQIENIFRNSNNSDLLFDTFQDAITNKIDDIELYKILLANTSINEDEITLFTEKLCELIPEKSFEFYNWTAKVFESKPFSFRNIEYSFQYYSKAILSYSDDPEPFINSLNLINFDLDLPLNKIILNFIESSVVHAKKKSSVYYSIANVYKKFGNIYKEKEFLRLAALNSNSEISNNIQ